MAGTQLDADRAEAVGDERAHVGIQAAYGVLIRFHDGHVQTPFDQRLGDLQPDVAAAHDHRRAGVVDREVAVQHLGVAEGLHAMDAVRVDPRQIRTNGRAPVATMSWS